MLVFAADLLPGMARLVRRGVMNELSCDGTSLGYCP